MLLSRILLPIAFFIIVFSMPVVTNAAPSLQALRSHGVYQESGDYYSLGEAHLSSVSKLSRRNAYTASETEAVYRLLRYLRFSDVKYPQSLLPLKGRLENTLEKIYPSSNYELRGMQLIHQNNDDQHAWSVIKVSGKDLKNIPHIVGRIDELVFQNLRSAEIKLPPELFYECLSLNYQDYADDNIAREISSVSNLSNLKNYIEGNHLTKIPTLWWAGENSLTSHDLRSVDDTELLGILNAGVLLKWCHAEVYKEFERRGYKRFSERLKEFFPSTDVNLDPPVLRGLFEIVTSHPAQSPDLPGVSFFTQLLKMRAFLPIENHGLPVDQDWRNAKDLNSQDNPDYLKIYSYCVRSLMKRPTAEAFNLMGESLQSMADSQLALLCYGQALQIDPDHPQAAANIAVLVNKLGNSKFAQTMALVAFKNPKLSAQAKSDLYEAGFKTQK